jgi:outer membrane autotransporter protein
MQVTGAVSGLVQRRAGDASMRRGDTTRGFWAQGIGGALRRQAHGASDGWTNSFGGLVAGYEGAPYADLRIGAFGGGALSAAQAGQDRASGTYVLGGLYGRFQPGAAFVDFNLVGGYVADSNKRAIASNIAPGAVETASARIDGWYVSPQVGAGYRIEIDQSGAITPAAKLRYLAAQYGSYAESGATAAIAGAARLFQAIDARGEIELSRTRRSANGSRLRLYETLGVSVETRLSGGVGSATIFGLAISLINPARSSTLAAYFGAGAEWRTARGATLFANVEAEMGLDRSISAYGRAGAAWMF